MVLKMEIAQRYLPPSENTIDADVIDISLSRLIAGFYHSRWLILTVTLLVTICGVTGALYTAQYKSGGFFQFGEPGITFSDYKRFSASFTTNERFSEYVHAKKLDSVAGIDELGRIFSSRAGIGKAIEPVYPFTKLDAKMLMDQPKERSNNVVGLDINVSSSDPQTAQQMVGLLGRYAVDTVLYVTYSDMLRFKHSETLSKLIQLDNTIIANREKLEEYHRKNTNLKQILSRYPTSVNPQSQQVVSVDEDSARYLSPVTQLAANDVLISEANEKILTAKRAQRQATLLGEYYAQAELLLATKSGEAVLRDLDRVKERVFKDKDLNDEVIKEVYNKISIENQKTFNTYLEKSRFIAGPTISAKSSARPALALVGSLVLGLLLSLILVFIREWWIQNRSQIYERR
jgi:hypothetical protein